MPFQKKTASLTVKIFILALAAIGLVTEFATWGEQAWRLFNVWIMLITGVYFLIETICQIAHRKEHNAKNVLSSRIMALLVVNNLIILMSHIISWFAWLDLPVNAGGFGDIIVCYIVPILVLLDWSCFAQKGQLRPSDPFYFLAPAMIYTALIIITANNAATVSPLLYPYECLDYANFGIIPMSFAILMVTVSILLGGFIFLVCDFAASGKLSSYVVLPKIKTVVLVDAPKPDIALSVTASNSVRKGVKDTSRKRSVNNVSAPSIAKAKNKQSLPGKDESGKTKTKTESTKNLLDSKASGDQDQVKVVINHGKSKKSPTKQTSDKTKLKASQSEYKDKKQQKLANVGKLQPILDQDSKKTTRTETTSASRSNHSKSKRTSVRPANTSPADDNSTSKKTEFKIPRSVQEDSESRGKTEPAKKSGTKNIPKTDDATTSMSDTNNDSKSEFHLPDQTSKPKNDKNSAYKNNHEGNSQQDNAQTKNIENNQANKKNKSKSKSSSIRHF